jgi:hypothetical protein
MFSKLKLLLTAAIALSALAAIVSSAQATTSFSITPGGPITSSSLGKLTFFSSAATIECEVTLKGSMSSGGLIKLVEGLLMGAITEVSINKNEAEAENPRGCRGGRVGEVLTLPWRIVFRKLKTSGGVLTELGGTATRAKTILILGTKFKLLAFGGLGQCLYEGNSEGEVLMNVVETEARRARFTSGLVRANEAVLLSLHEGAFCPSTGGFKGSFGLTPQQTIIKRIP